MCCIFGRLLHNSVMSFCLSFYCVPFDTYFHSNPEGHLTSTCCNVREGPLTLASIRRCSSSLWGREQASLQHLGSQACNKPMVSALQIA